MFSFIRNYFTYVRINLSLCEVLENRIVNDIKKDNHKVSLANAFIMVKEKIEDLDIPEKYKNKLINRLDFCYSNYIIPKYRKYVAVL